MIARYVSRAARLVLLSDLEPRAALRAVDCPTPRLELAARVLSSMSRASLRAAALEVTR